MEKSAVRYEDETLVVTRSSLADPPAHRSRLVSQGVPVLGERRSAPEAGRLSWAADLPFVPTSRTDRAAAEGWRNRYRAQIAATDAASAAVVMAVTGATLPWPNTTRMLAVAVGVVAWSVVVGLLRGYDRRHSAVGPHEFQALLRAGLVMALLIAITSYATVSQLPRRIVLVSLPLVLLLSAVLRYLARRRLHRERVRGQAQVRTLLVGDPDAVLTVSDILERSPHEGHEVVGVCGPVDPPLGTSAPLPVLGAVSEIPQVVHDHDVDVVVVAGGHLSHTGLRRLSWALEHTGAELVVAPGLVEVLGPRLTLRPTAGLSLLHVESASARRGQRLGKRMLDSALGSLLALASLPVVAAAAMAVRLTSRGPAFFTQTRVGQDGRTFTMYKLRTMVVDAESRRSELLGSSDRDGLMFKMRSDPRVTPVGAFLRRFSLDELPQLLNVVRGEMSLVGPRPPLVEEYDLYQDEVYRRLRVRPGLTGLWQVSGRADLAWDEAIRLDLRYVDNWSVTMDLFILWKTARSVLGASGAY